MLNPNLSWLNPACFLQTLKPRLFTKVDVQIIIWIVKSHLFLGDIHIFNGKIPDFHGEIPIFRGKILVQLPPQPPAEPGEVRQITTQGYAATRQKSGTLPQHIVSCIKIVYNL